MADNPTELRYTKEHEWIRVTDKIVRIGITAFAVEQLGDVTMVELPIEGDRFDQDEVFGAVESVKAVSDLHAPVTGKVITVNSPLDDSPEYVNQAPYDEGWMVEMELTKPEEIEGLMDAAAYEEYLAEND